MKAAIIIFLLSTVTNCIGQANTSTKKKEYHFAVIPKQVVNSPFFDEIREGCEARARELGNVHCVFVGPDQANATDQSRFIEDLIGRVDGIAVAVLDEHITGDAITKVAATGIPVITFDSDAPDSRRKSYTGTDNFKMGVALGKVLKQLNPNGGTYGIISSSGPNLRLRMDGLREELYESMWLEAGTSPRNCHESHEIAFDICESYAADPNINAIVPVGGWPMHNITRWKKFVDANRHVTLVVADSSPQQLRLLSTGYVNGLVGQMPYEMGQSVIDNLLNISVGVPIEEEILGTNILELLKVPLVLPDPNVDRNYLGSLAVMGYVLSSTVLFLSVCFSVWCWVFRNFRIVKASQPMFLVMLCSGTLLMGSSIIPMSIDSEFHSQRACDVACMSKEWLFFIGFVTTFSALFSKTWRVNRMLYSGAKFQRVKISVKDVIAPYVLLLMANAVVLVCWTIFAPVQYVRAAHSGTDGWNRVISTFGFCNRRTGSLPYVVALQVINAGVLIIANIQAYLARNVKTEYSESRYIALVMASMLQVWVVGVPVMVLVWDQPKTRYILEVLIVFVTCMAVLLFIFVPKMVFLRNMGNTRARTKLHEDVPHSRTDESAIEDEGGSDGLRVKVVNSKISHEVGERDKKIVRENKMWAELVKENQVLKNENAKLHSSMKARSNRNTFESHIYFEENDLTTSTLTQTAFPKSTLSAVREKSECEGSSEDSSEASFESGEMNQNQVWATGLDQLTL